MELQLFSPLCRKRKIFCICFRDAASARTRIWGEGKINDTWTYNLMLQNEQIITNSCFPPFPPTASSVMAALRAGMWALAIPLARTFMLWLTILILSPSLAIREIRLWFPSCTSCSNLIFALHVSAVKKIYCGHFIFLKYYRQMTRGEV